MNVLFSRGFSLLALCAVLALPVLAAEPWEADRLFNLTMDWYDTRAGKEKVNAFDAEAKGVAKGTPLTPETWAVKSSISGQRTAPAGVTVWPIHPKMLWTGGANQAVAWPAKGNVHPAAGAISLFVQGDNWDAGTAARETLIVLEGKAGTLAVEKSAPSTLAVTLNGTALITTPYTAPHRCHHIVVNYEKGKVALYLDRRLVGDKEGVTLPTEYERLVVGQLGPGAAAANKFIDDVAIYRRPLLPGEVAKIYYLEGQHELLKLVTLPRLTTPVKIDGIFDAGEWDRAAGICGFVDQSRADSYVFYAGPGKPFDVEDTIRLAYDDEYLYFAYDNPPPASIKGNAPIIAAMLKVTRPGFDTDVDADDSLFIDIHRPYPYGDMYHLIVNGLNTHYEFSDGGAAKGSLEQKRDLQFNPKWITASTLTVQHGWRLEGKIPWADMKMAPPKPGETLHANFIRYWRNILSGSASWAQGIRHGEDDTIYYVPAGALRFGGPQDVVVQLHGIGSLTQGNLHFQATLLNPTQAEARVRVELSSNTGEITQVQEVAIPAGGAKPVSLKARVTRPDTGEVVFRVINAADNTVLFASGHPLVRKDHPDIYLRKYPSWDLVKFETDFTALSQHQPADIAAALTITPAQGGTAVATGKAAKFTDYHYTFEQSTKGWKPGNYLARITFTAGGKVLDTAEQPFAIKPLPAWYNNTIGFDDPERPPYPFARMEVRDDREVCVWGRSYRFNDALLPAQIEIRPDLSSVVPRYPGNGRPLLRAPMRLVGVVDDMPFSTESLKASAEWTAKRGTLVTGTRKVTAGNLAVSADIRMEYDGFCWVTLTLAPVKGSVTISSLALEEAFTKEFSDVVNAGEYSLVGTGPMPSEPMIKSFQKPCWIGNGDGGLQTFTDTLAYFHVKDQGATLQLLPQPEGAVLRLNMVDKPLTLTKATTMAFGINATPTRPRQWRTPTEQQLGKRNSYFAWYQNPGAEWIVGDPSWAKTYWNSAMMNPDQNGGWFRSQPYLNTDAIPVNDPDVLEFGDEWLANTSDRWRDRLGKTGEMINVTYHAKSYRDWVMHRMKALFDAAPFAGVYYDVVSPVSSANPYANAGMERDGARLATSSLLGLRELFKRLYVMSRHTYPDGSTMIHNSGSPNMAYMAFGEIFFDGENLNSTINAQQPTYRGIMTPAKFRAEYMGHNFGPQVWWLGQGRITRDTMLQYGPDVLEDHLAGLMLLHQTPVVFAGGFSQLHGKESIRRIYDAIRQYNLYGSGYRFLPYWQQPPVTGLRQDQYASFYVREPLKVDYYHWHMFTREETDETLPHRAVGIFCNESDWRGEMVVQVDLQKLGFAPGAKVRAVNAVHSTGYRLEGAGSPQEKVVFFPKPDETATLNGSELRFPMSEWNFRMIVLEEVP